VVHRDHAVPEGACARVYDTRQHLESTREGTARIRETVLADLGARLDEVAEMEVALAHLHVPELACPLSARSG